MLIYPSIDSNQFGQGIRRIVVAGFKSLASKADAEIRPLTVLAGANSSGKSSLMQPLLLMKQTLESSVIPAGPFLLSGSYTRYTETKQFLSHSGPTAESNSRLDVDFELGEKMTAGMTYAAEPNAVFGVVEARGSLTAGKTVKSWKIKHDSSPEYLMSLDLPWELVGIVAKNPVSQVNRYKYYLRLQFFQSQAYEELLETQVLNNEIRRLIHIPGLRGDQLRKWLLADVPAKGAFEGWFESYVPSLIDSWQQSGDDRSITELIAALNLLGLASSVATERLNESEVEMRVPRMLNSGDNDYVNVADVGLAVSTALPVLVALIQAAPGQLVYIEQPELHLHPKAQVLIAQVLADAANRGVRLVIETHSSLLLRGILTEIAKDRITNDKVILHWFERDKVTGLSTVHSKEPDSAGRVGDWPEDFGDVELGSENDYLNAVEGKMLAEKK